MISIIRKDIMSSGLKLQTIYVVILSVLSIMLFFDIVQYLVIVAYGIIIIAPLAYFGSVFNYTTLDYHKEELMLPVKRPDIVTARYVNYLFLTGTNFMLVLGFIWLYESNVTLLETSMKSAIFLTMAVGLHFGSIVLGSAFLFGHKHIKTIILASFLLTIVPVRLLMEGIKIIMKLDGTFDAYNYPILMILFIGGSILLYGLSFGVSLISFNQKF